MPSIPEGSCDTVACTQVQQPVTTPQAQNRWFITDTSGTVTTANGTFPGSTGSNANGWSVSGTVSNPTVCPPAGSKRAQLYRVFLDLSAGLSIGATTNNYQGTFTVVNPVAPCARPAPPVFTAQASGTAINLTGTY